MTRRINNRALTAMLALLFLLSAAAAFAGPVTYTYDAANRLIYENSNGTVTHYTYDKVNGEEPGDWSGRAFLCGVLSIDRRDDHDGGPVFVPGIRVGACGGSAADGQLQCDNNDEPGRRDTHLRGIADSDVRVAETDETNNALAGNQMTVSSP